jgi:peptide/histidine transporter 3/4
MTLSASVRGLHPDKCSDPSSCKQATSTQVNWFYAGLYMVSVAQSGLTPCETSLGKDQFEEGHPKEDKHGQDFFKLFFVNGNASALVGTTVGFYVQSHFGYSWGWGGILVIFVVCSLIFIGGTPYYRYVIENCILVVLHILRLDYQTQSLQNTKSCLFS